MSQPGYDQPLLVGFASGDQSKDVLCDRLTRLHKLLMVPIFRRGHLRVKGSYLGKSGLTI